MTGRDQKSLTCTGNGNADGKFLIVSGILHHGDFDLAQRGNVCNRRTGNAAKEHGSKHVHKGQTAAETSHQNIGKLQQSV